MMDLTAFEGLEEGAFEEGRHLDGLVGLGECSKF